MATLERRAYAEIFGPTVGDRVRLADTDLVIEVEQDFTLRAGDVVRIDIGGLALENAVLDNPVPGNGAQ